MKYKSNVFPFQLQEFHAIITPIIFIPNDSDKHPSLSVIGCSAHATIIAFSIILIGILVSSSTNTTWMVFTGLSLPWLDMREDEGVPICPAARIKVCLCLFRLPQPVNKEMHVYTPQPRTLQQVSYFSDIPILHQKVIY